MARLRRLPLPWPPICGVVRSPTFPEAVRLGSVGIVLSTTIIGVACAPRATSRRCATHSAGVCRCTRTPFGSAWRPWCSWPPRRQTCATPAIRTSRGRDDVVRNHCPLSTERSGCRMLLSRCRARRRCARSTASPYRECGITRRDDGPTTAVRAGFHPTQRSLVTGEGAQSWRTGRSRRRAPARQRRPGRRPSRSIGTGYRYCPSTAPNDPHRRGHGGDPRLAPPHCAQPHRRTSASERARRPPRSAFPPYRFRSTTRPTPAPRAGRHRQPGRRPARCRAVVRPFGGHNAHTHRALAHVRAERSHQSHRAAGNDGSGRDMQRIGRT